MISFTASSVITVNKKNILRIKRKPLFHNKSEEKTSILALNNLIIRNTRINNNLNSFDAIWRPNRKKKNLIKK